MSKTETVFNTTAETFYLPAYDALVKPGGEAQVSAEDAACLVAGGLWSLKKSGGTK